MRDGILQKAQSPQRNPKVQMRVFFVAWVLNFGWKNKYILTENLLKIPQSGVDKIRLAGLENTCCVEVDPQEGIKNNKRRS